MTLLENNKTTDNRPVSYVWLGLLMLAAGILLVCDRLNAGVPAWLVSWPMIIIAVGVLIAIYKFKTYLWLIPLFWGIFLLVEQQEPSLQLDKYATALAFIIPGIVLIIQRKRFRNYPADAIEYDTSSLVKIMATVTNTKRAIVTDDFKGADVTCVMGNVEIDLRKAGLKNKALLDITTVMGSVKVIMPPNWALQNDLTSVFGSAEDNRRIKATLHTEEKVLKLDGTAVFGSIVITSD